MEIEEKYATLLQELGEVIAVKNAQMRIMQADIDTLKKALTTAEEKLTAAENKIADLTF